MLVVLVLSILGLCVADGFPTRSFLRSLNPESPDSDYFRLSITQTTSLNFLKLDLLSKKLPYLINSTWICYKDDETGKTTTWQISYKPNGPSFSAECHVDTDMTCDFADQIEIEEPKPEIWIRNSMAFQRYPIHQIGKVLPIWSIEKQSQPPFAYAPVYGFYTIPPDVSSLVGYVELALGFEDQFGKEMKSSVLFDAENRDI